MVCKSNKSTYELKQASRQWYLKFSHTITSYGFIEIIVDQYIYMKVSGNKFIILVVYVEVIIPATSNIGMIHEVKNFLEEF